MEQVIAEIVIVIADGSATVTVRVHISKSPQHYLEQSDSIKKTHVGEIKNKLELRCTGKMRGLLVTAISQPDA